MMADEVYTEIDDQVVDIEEVGDADFKMNPDLYIHTAILKAQNALVNPDIRAGFLQFRVMVENIEVLAKARNRLPENYEADITTFKTTEDYTKAEDIIKPVRLAHKKMELLLTEIFKGTIATAPLRLDSKR